MRQSRLCRQGVRQQRRCVVGDLLTFPGGDEFYWMPVTESLQGQSFRETLSLLKERSNCIAVAVAGDGGDYAINPPGDRLMKQGDRLLLIAKEQPVMP